MTDEILLKGKKARKGERMTNGTRWRLPLSPAASASFSERYVTRSTLVASE